MRSRNDSSNRHKREILTAYGLLLPSLLGMTVFVLLPFLDILRRSFFQAVGSTFVGLDNYMQVLQNEAFQKAASHTVRFLIVCLPLLLGLSFLFALFIYRLPFWGSIFKTGFLFPMALPVASVVVFWRMTFHNQGILNQVLGGIGIQGMDWMNTSSAFWVLVFSYIWKNLGYDMILWIAGLSEIPEEQYEAARVSGAGKFQCFLYITLPQMKSSITMITVLSFVNAFRIFREAYLIAGDYPDDSIYMLQHLFNNWFTKLDIQKMCAAAVMLSLVIAVILILLQRWSERQEDGH